MRVALIAVVSVSCGRIAFDPLAGPDSDAALGGPTCNDGVQNGGETEIDCGGPCLACAGQPCGNDGDCSSGKCDAGGSCLPGCLTWSDFSTPVVLGSVNDTNDNWGPEVTTDGLTLLLCTAGNLFVATRSSSGAMFASPTPVPGIAAGVNQCDPSIAGDALELFYGDYVNPRTVMTARRTTTADAWGPPSAVAGLPTGNLYGPWISKDGLRLYLTDTTGSEDIVMTSRAARTDSFGSVLPVFTGNTGDYYPSLSADELVIVFGSTRSGGAQKSDLWMATRSIRAQPFGPPVAVPGPINTNKNEYDPGLSAYGDVLYFSSDRASADTNIYVATRSCLD